MGDRFFDLANFSINHELDAAESQKLLHAYFGELREEDVHALQLMRFMSDFREAMWGSRADSCLGTRLRLRCVRN